jgi:hypothetical protein
MADDNTKNTEVPEQEVAAQEQTSEDHQDGPVEQSTTAPSHRRASSHGGFSGFFRDDKMTVFPIVIFSFLSLLTTTSGMLIFVPIDDKLAGYAMSALPALGVQALMLNFAWKIKKEGVKRSLVLVYSIAAIVSMSFSYIGLFKYYSGGFINEEQRERFDQEFANYSRDLGTYLATARNEVEQAVRVATEAAAAESSRGGATALNSTSPYFNALLEEAGLDLKNRSSDAGKGPIYNWLTATVSALQSQTEHLDRLHELHMELTSSGVLYKGSRDAKVNAAYNFETQTDWPLIERIVTARGVDFVRPVLPVMPQVGGATGPEATRQDEIKWSIDAFRALRDTFSNPVVGIPVFVAIILDLVVLLVAILFRDSARLMPDQIAIRKSIARVLDTLGMAETELYSGLHSILHFADSRGSGGKKSWSLHADRVERMSPSGKLILLQLARARLAKEPWLREELVLSDDVHTCLNEHYARMQQRGLRAEA